jgi:hypothetical protein
MSTRERLPNRRVSETFELEVNGLHYTCTISRFRDGRIAEVFLQNHKPASQSDSNARDAAQGRPSTPLGAAIDAVIAEGGE